MPDNKKPYKSATQSNYKNVPIDRAGFACSKEGLIARLATAKRNYTTCKENESVNYNTLSQAAIELKTAEIRADKYLSKLSDSQKITFYNQVERQVSKTATAEKKTELYPMFRIHCGK